MTPVSIEPEVPTANMIYTSFNDFLSVSEVLTEKKKPKKKETPKKQMSNSCYPLTLKLKKIYYQ